jgi:hypothetical protein
MTYRLGTCPLLGTYLVSPMYMNKLLTHNMTFDLLESLQTTKLLPSLLEKIRRMYLPGQKSEFSHVACRGWGSCRFGRGRE